MDKYQYEPTFYTTFRSLLVGAIGYFYCIYLEMTKDIVAIQIKLLYYNPKQALLKCFVIAIHKISQLCKLTSFL